MSPKSWQKTLKGEYYYIRLEGGEVHFGNIFEGGKSGLEWRCPFDVFLHDPHEIKPRMAEIFGQSIISEVKQEILQIFAEFSNNL